MRIVHVVRQFRPGIGGLETYVEGLAGEQARAGHTVTVVTLNRLFTAPGRRLPARDHGAGYGVVRLPWTGSHKYPIAPGFLRHLKDADIVHVHSTDFFFDAAAWTRPWHGKPLVATTHGGFFHTNPDSRLKKLFFNTITRLSSRAYHAVLASGVNDYRLFAGICADRLILIENGVDTGKLRDCASPTFTRTMATIGRFSSNKRLDRLIGLLRHLREQDGDWTLDILGIDWDLTGEDLRRIAEEQGVGNAVRVMVGLPDDQIRAVLGRCSFIASASEYEGFGLSIIEGMSAGLLPLLNDIPSFRRMREDSGLGLVGNFGDPAALAARLHAATPDVAAGYADQRRRAMEYADTFSWAGVSRSIDQVYAAALAGRPASTVRNDTETLSSRPG